MRIRERKEDGNLGEYVSVDQIYTPDPSDLDGLKAAKMAELKSARDAELLAGFTSSATGAALYFGYDPIDQAYLHKKATMLTLDPTIITIDWKTRDGFVNFTRDQFIQVLKDGEAHEESLVYKVLYAEAYVTNATSKAEIDAIVW